MTNRANFQIALLSGLIALGGTALLAQEPPQQDRFVQLDTNGDGQLTQEEMKAHAEARFAKADTDGDGFLSETEMQAAAAERRAERSQRMMTKLDKDGNGSLSVEEQYYVFFPIIFICK